MTPNWARLVIVGLGSVQGKGERGWSEPKTNKQTNNVAVGGYIAWPCGGAGGATLEGHAHF